jgi:hypothetical protein
MSSLFRGNGKIYLTKYAYSYYGPHLRWFSAGGKVQGSGRKAQNMCALTTKYQQLISNKLLKSDARQRRLIESLSDILPKFQAKSVPRGLYIYGPVGTGKSILFDLFCEAAKQNLPTNSVARFHFHEFMLMIHKRIHEYKQQASNSEGAVKTVGRELVEKGGLRLLCLDEFQVSTEQCTHRQFPLPLRCFKSDRNYRARSVWPLCFCSGNQADDRHLRR